MNKYNSAFTLAEMMVVVLILSIVLAALVPIVTSKLRTGGERYFKSITESPWKWVNDSEQIDAYLNEPESSTRAMIGQEAAQTAEKAKLIINIKNQNDYSHIMFKDQDGIIGNWSFNDNGSMFLSEKPTAVGTNNVGIGKGTFANIEPEARDNIAIGSGYTDDVTVKAPLQSLTTGKYNIALGSGAGGNLTTGEGNIAIGQDALAVATTQSYNTAIGYQSLMNNTASNNTAIGTKALKSNTTGEYNTALGSAGEETLDGSGNCTDNCAPLQNNISGSNNFALGTNALAKSKYSNNNVALGYNALKAFDVGTSDSLQDGNNVAIGNNALLGLTNQVGGNIGIGANTMFTTGCSGTPTKPSIAIGMNALQTGVGCSGNIAIGVNALQYVASSDNIAIGVGALKSVPNAYIKGGSNIYIGKSGNYDNYREYEGTNNIVINQGDSAASIQGSHNIGLGFNSITTHHLSAANFFGSYNLVIGSVGLHDIFAMKSIAIGRGAMYVEGNSSNSGQWEYAGPSDGDVYIGAYSGAIAGGSSNFDDWYGYKASKKRFYNNFATKYSRKQNTALGFAACELSISKHNTCVGNFAGPYINAIYSKYNDPYTGVVGNPNNYAADVYAVDNRVFIGTPGDTVYISGNMEFRNAASNLTYKNSIYSSSDRRLKHVGRRFTAGLNKISELKVFNYTFKDAPNTPRVGVIAQDLQKVFPNAVKEGLDKFLSIRFEDMFYAIVNAVQELDKKIEKLAQQLRDKQYIEDIKTLDQETSALEARLDKLEAEMR